jgi:predicted DCC family thiol-disulfide oxidoreductase YuxK
MPHPILLYDGVCGLCNRLVQFILRRDRTAIFRFASLQSPLAASILSRHGVNPTDLDTVYLVLNQNAHDESLLSRSEAILFVLKQLTGIWSAVASALKLFPSPFCDALYQAVARNRYKVFGRHPSCPIASPETRNRFLDQ